VDIGVVFDRDIPVITVAGRFDALGADIFDATVASLATSARCWVLDTSGVPYVSSIGLRSLVALEKRLRARGGGVVLASPTTFVKQVLRIAQLDAWLRSAPSLTEALDTARALAAAGSAVERTVDGRRVHVRHLGSPGSTLEWWDAGTEASGRLIGTTLSDLGFAFGTASLGDVAADARAGVGAFVGTPLFAGVRPSHGLADFTPGIAPDAVAVHVATAIGLAGTPALSIAIQPGEATFDTASTFDGLFDLVAQELGRTIPAVGFVALTEEPGDTAGALTIAIVLDERQARTGFDGDGRLRAWPLQLPLPSGRVLAGSAIVLGAGTHPAGDATLADAVRTRAHLDALQGLSEPAALPPMSRGTVWAFVPDALKGGAEKLLQIALDGDADWRPEWDAIIRRLYADCRAVTLTPLHGGYMSKTFRAVAYDHDGRRTLPTVVKIGATALTAREEQANRQYVARFILNNGTTVLGGAAEGDWAGLRYNFLGVNGPDSRLVWLREHYLTRPTSDVVRLFESLLTRVLKPWYGQPKWEQVSLYRDHTPLRLFPALLEVAQRDLGFDPDAPVFTCDELGEELPSPFHFLAHEFPVRAAQSRLWYTTISHGDLNMQNVLVDERENVYVIDFSETRPRNAVADFARIEPILKFEMIPIDTDEALRLMLQYEVGLTSVTRSGDPLPFSYRGTDPRVAHAHAVIALLRRCADTVTLFEQDMVPYWVALLEWTLASVCFVQLSVRQKRYAAISAALICREILRADAPA
jgi:anti-anti-sigma factor